MPDIHKAGLLVIRENRLLLCRKNRTTSLLILPGGKIEAGESADACLVRELREELGDVRLVNLEWVGTYCDAAAGAEDRLVKIELYRAELEGNPAPQAEIVELIWFGEQDDESQLAPSLRNKIIPDLISRRILSWSATN